MSEIAQLKLQRQALGWSLEALAERTGYARGTIWRMEQGDAVRWQVVEDVRKALASLGRTAGQQESSRSLYQARELACERA